VEPAARPERQPGRRHARPPWLLSVEQSAGRIGACSDVPENLITLNYMALRQAETNHIEFKEKSDTRIPEGAAVRCAR